jgi:uncharacterized protein YbbC (DUF1343 family)
MSFKLIFVHVSARYCAFFAMFLALSSNYAFGLEKESLKITTGAEQMTVYLPLLKHKNVAVIINQTSIVGQSSLLDTLLKSGVHVVKIFVPEHGFRGVADAGAKIKNDIDATTGLPVISLYGKNKKPSKEQLNDVDVLIYDLQDVGVRFYTYISTLEYAMDACIENDKQLIVMDRPNPNGSYVDGPVLDTALRSFVGMQPVPVVYGMTAGEYALLLKGEHWVKNADRLSIKVVACQNYKHSMRYELPVAPSPNLKSMAAVYLYPSLCLFEGTVVSVGRGTNMPFQQWGHPDFKDHATYFFTPKSTIGASNPLLAAQNCYGQLVAADADVAFERVNGKFDLSYLIKAYQWYSKREAFFNPFFEKLAGTKMLSKQIEQSMTADQIRATWQPAIESFKKIRKKYLLYVE